MTIASMSERNVTLPNHYILQIIEIVEHAGVSAEGWLRHLGIEPDKEEEESLVTMPWATFRRFLQDAGRFSKDKALGLMIGERLLINTHGTLGYAAMSSGTTRQIVDLLEQYMVLRTDLLTMDTAEEGDCLQVRFDDNGSLEDVQRPVTEAIVLAIRNILDFTTMGTCDIRSVTFPFDGDEKLAEAVFRCPVAYNQECAGFTLPLTSIDKPLKMANTVSYQEALKVCRQELDKLPTEHTWSARVRRLMLQNRRGFPSLEMTARRFHITPRTLHRRLIDESTSYREVLEGVRHQLAIRYLQTGRMTVQEISFALGYSDIANFRKAFKRWESVPPTEYNRHSRAD
ncbi:AraC family transcriptional regulator [Marinobacter zhejiangensis]|uniref:Transcriptional regulator, AraC family n=1 Tax=Marinobacter zhejiangensis TaxID=488535 RepID=A0A1I4PEP7_9GAMM|nr:AraC family transcriptional regulator [Marinobacter zhejiangensis]SFM26241.1 transcriptional regulator, AraC family [Marinobacter zhejiangensis]